MNFCLDDGSELVYGSGSESPTLFVPAQDRSESATAILHPASTSNKASAKLLAWFRKPSSIILTASLIIVAALIAVKFGRWPARPAPLSEIHSIAVLPLQNLSGDPSQEYFADGMTDALISDLSQIRSINVISRTSAMRFKGSHDSLPDIAHALGVDAVIEGSVMRSDGRVRITAQLVPATTDAAIWSRSYERDMPDLLKLQSDVAQAIASEIKVNISSAETARLSISRTVDPQASEEFLLGNYYVRKRTDASIATAIDHFNRAVALQPNYAAAWAGLSDAWFERSIWGSATHSEVEPSVRSAAQKALDLDPELSASHIAVSSLNMNYDWDWTAGEYHAKRAIDLDPSNSEAYDAYAWYLLDFGRFDEMKQMMATAEHLDPVSSIIQSDFGRMLYRARAFSDAETHLRRAIELDEKNLAAYGRLVDVLREEGRFDEALAVAQAGKDKGATKSVDFRRVTVLAQMGRTKDALDLWNTLPSKTPTESAQMATILGDADKAFEEFNRALDERVTVLAHIRVDPTFDKLHPDPRWAKLLARMNLPPS